MGPDIIFQKLEPVSLLPFPNVEMLANDSKNCKTSRANQNRCEGQISASGCQCTDLRARPLQGMRCLLAPAQPLRLRRPPPHPPPHPPCTCPPHSQLSFGEQAQRGFILHCFIGATEIASVLGDPRPSQLLLSGP